MPTARASLATENRRACCTSNVCILCPVDAKFTVLNEMAATFGAVRVEYEAQALAVETEAGRATGILYKKDGRERRARADLVALGANALFNAHILLRSGMRHASLGRGVVEQRSITLVVDLEGLDNYDGGSSLTGHGYMLYDGEHRRSAAACLIETSNIPALRLEPGRYRQSLPLKLIFEELPDPESRVTLGDDPDRPVIRAAPPSEYLRAGRDRAVGALPEILSALPVESIGEPSDFHGSEAHLLGGTVMGGDPADSVVDADLRVHGVAGLFALGGGSFPTISPANPTLTLSALSLRAAERAFR